MAIDENGKTTDTPANDVQRPRVQARTPRESAGTVVPTSTRIALLHHIGGANLGDGATMDAVIQNIRGRWPDAELIGVTMGPDDTRRRHGIPSYPASRQQWTLGTAVAQGPASFRQKMSAVVRKHRLLLGVPRAIYTVAVRLPAVVLREVLFLARSLRVIRSVDLLVVAGGGQLIELSGGPPAFIGGALGFPYTIFKWVSLARVGGVPSCVLDVGAGPLVSPLSRFFVKSALSSSAYVSFRDEESRALVRRIGFKGRADVFPDAAYSLQMPPGARPPAARRTRTTVGLAPMAYREPRLSPGRDPVQYATFIETLGQFAAWLISQGHDVTLFCTDIGLDPPVIEALASKLKNNADLAAADGGGVLSCAQQRSTEEVLANMASMDYAVVCRFHGVVFAHMLNIPVLAFGHHPKNTALMNHLGLSEYCIDVESCHLSVLIERFGALVSNRTEIKARMAETLMDRRQRLQEQFDQLFPDDTRGAAAVDAAGR